MESNDRRLAITRHRRTIFGVLAAVALTATFAPVAFADEPAAPTETATTASTEPEPATTSSIPEPPSTSAEVSTPTGPEVSTVESSSTSVADTESIAPPTTAAEATTNSTTDVTTTSTTEPAATPAAEPSTASTTEPPTASAARTTVESASDPAPLDVPAAADEADGLIVPFAANDVATVTKTAAVPGGGPVQPGMTFTYQIYAACSSTEVDCPGFTFTDVIPAGLEIVQLPVTNPTRSVAFDAGTRTLTMTYNVPTNNPAGIGWTSGANEAFDIIVRLPADTDHADGDVISNTATVNVTGYPALTDDADVTVDIPVVITPIPSKQWPGSGVYAGSDADTTVSIGAANGSPSSLDVTSLSVTDTTAATWERFDLTLPITVTALPAGATQAQLQVCTLANSACGASGWVDGGTAGEGGTLALPGAVATGDVTGIRVVFTGDPLESAPGDGGTVQFGLRLRDTLRSGGAVQPGAVSNCATAEASEAGGTPTVSAPSCAPKQIWPSDVTITSNKVWVADTDGNYQREAGEFAVAGDESPVSARVRATNASPFPIQEIVIREPSSAPEDFDAFDVETIRLTYPAGATTARVQVTYAGGGTSDISYTPGDPTTITIGGPPNPQVTSVTVTYTGGDASDPAIAASATAGLDLHGRLTADVDTAGTLTNCADVTAAGGAGSTAPPAQRPCGDLPVEAPDASGTGVKNASQTTLPLDQPVTFTMDFDNDGNLALTNPVLTDPVDPAATPNPFDSLMLVSASSSSTPTGLTRVIEVTTDGGTSWTPYATPVPSTVNGVRVRVVGQLPPETGDLRLSITVQRRPGIADGAVIQNCFGASAVDAVALLGGGGACASVTAADPAGAATIAKTIDPDALPQWTPGLAPQEAEVVLRAANTGNLNTSFLQITDDDSDFFDAVDFARFGAVQGAAGSNRLQIEALLGGTWQQVYLGNASGTPSPTFPGTFTAADVRGLRFTFSNTDTTTNGGFLMPPCAGVAAGCAGVVRFDVQTRPSLVSDPGTPVPAALNDTATGTYLTNVDPPGNPPSTNESTDGLELVPGDPRIDVDKAPGTMTLGPGSSGLQTLTVTNNGTTWLDDVAIVDALPAGLAFDELYDSGDGAPYAVTVDDLPAGYDPAPAPSFAIDRPGERIDAVRWTFEGWAMPPNATITITFQVGLEPGVTAGQTITNTMGATGVSGNPSGSLACTAPDGTATDSEMFGSGTYCTDTADTGVIAGAAFQARKWVAGNPALGWWHSTLGFVATGDSNCPTMDAGGVLFTATPCIALVDRGGQFDYVLRVVNAGTEAATRMALVDNLPYQGDSGLVGGTPRGTAWNNRPTLAGPATYTGPGTGTIGYSSAAGGAWCTADLTLGGPGCDAGDWADAAGSSTTALRLLADFEGDPLEPGTGIDVRFAMDVPTALQQDSEVMIAWNSFAHAEATQTAIGGERILPAVEPIKVGVSPFLPGKVSVGDYVWVDTDRDGRQDPGEPGIPGVTLTITGPDGGSVIDIYGNPVGPTTTDGNGRYLFDNLPILPPGQSYTVHVDPTSPALAPYVPTTPGVGDRAGDSSTGSATSGDLTVDGAHDPTLDFGFVLPETEPPTTPPTTPPATTQPPVTSPPPATPPPTNPPPSTGTQQPGTLPVTGLQAVTLILLAGALVAAGGLTLLARRRQPRPTE